MKPMYVAVLVVFSALAGGLFMKWQIDRNSPQPAAAVSTQSPTAVQLPASAGVPAAAEQSQPAEAVQPPPAVGHQAPAAAPKLAAAHKEPKPKTTAHEVLKSQRAEPALVAQNNVPPANAAPPAQPVVQTPEVVVPPLEAQSQPTITQPAPAPEPASQPQVPVPASPEPNHVTVKSGTVISARTGQGLSSDRNTAGDEFSATLDQPLVVDGWVIAERGARLEGKIVEINKGKAQPELVLALTQLRTSDGQRVAIETETYSRRGQAASGESAAKVAVGTVLGAAIGAIAGGGKGAAIGAGAGTAAGAGVAVATRGRPAVVPAESLIRFRLKNPVTITERQGKS